MDRIVSLSMSLLPTGSDTFTNKLLVENTNSSLFHHCCSTIPFALDEATTESIKYTSKRIKYKFRLTKCLQHHSTLLISAIKSDNIQMIEFIMKYVNPLDFNIENKSGETALIIAIRLGKMKIIEILLTNGVNVNYETQSGRTALIEATKVSPENEKVIKYLIENGNALVSYRTIKHKKTALEWANLMNYERSLEELQLGDNVQLQIMDIFQCISCDDIRKLNDLIHDGIPFHPNSEIDYYNYKESCHLEVINCKFYIRQYEKDLERLNQSLNKNLDSLKIILSRDDIIKKNLVNLRKQENEILQSISSMQLMIESYCRDITPSDLLEVTRMKILDKSCILSMLAMVLLFDTLPLIHSNDNDDSNTIAYRVLESIASSSHGCDLLYNNDVKLIIDHVFARFHKEQIHHTISKITNLNVEMFSQIHISDKLYSLLTRISNELNQSINLIFPSSNQINLETPHPTFIIIDNERHYSIHRIQENQEDNKDKIVNEDNEDEEDEDVLTTSLHDKNTSTTILIKHQHTNSSSRDQAKDSIMRKSSNSHIPLFIRFMVMSLDLIQQAIAAGNELKVCLAKIQEESIVEASIVHQIEEIQAIIKDSKQEKQELESKVVHQLKVMKSKKEHLHQYLQVLRVSRLLNTVTASGHTALSWACSLGKFIDLRCFISSYE